MNLSLADRSLIVFGLSVILLFLLTAFESAFGSVFVGVPPFAERLILLVGFVLLPGFGAVLGVMSLIRREERAWLVLLSLMLNMLFAVFHFMIILFAG